MYREVDMREAILASVDENKTVYVIEPDGQGRADYIHPINLYKLSELRDNNYRYLIDEPDEISEEEVARCLEKLI